MDEDTESQSEDMNIVDISSPQPEEKVKKSAKDRQNTDNKNNSLSKLQVDNILDTENMKTMDGCLKILAQLNMSEVLEESE